MEKFTRYGIYILSVCVFLYLFIHIMYYFMAK